MNLFVRYFDRECIAKTVEEAMEFLASIEEIKLEPTTSSRITTFLNSSNLYPFRLKVSYSNYVLFLKTEAETLEEFKIEEAKRKEQKPVPAQTNHKKSILESLNEERYGWWEAGLLFKRVVTMPETGKCKYIDTRFRARIKAYSGMDAYNRIVDHLKSRPDVDARSQFPSAKSQNFRYYFVGESEDAIAEEYGQ